jgi:hypothetical protein
VSSLWKAMRLASLCLLLELIPCTGAISFTDLIISFSATFQQCTFQYNNVLLPVSQLQMPVEAEMKVWDFLLCIYSALFRTCMAASNQFSCTGCGVLSGWQGSGHRLTHSFSKCSILVLVLREADPESRIREQGVYWNPGCEEVR